MHIFKYFLKKKTDWKDASRAHTLKKLGCFNPFLGQMWINSNIGLKI